MSPGHQSQEQASKERLEFQDFKPYVGAEFPIGVQLGAEPAVHLTLIEAKSLGQPFRPGFREPFSLIFEGALAAAIQQGNFVTQHPTLGEQYIFLVPIGADNGKRQYQAIFN